MKLNLHKKPALLLIDIQKGFEDLDYWGGHRNNDFAEDNASQLLQVWRTKNLPIFHVKHCSTNPKSRLAEGQIGNDFKEVVMPLENETVIKKNVNSAFIGTNLQELLNQADIHQVIVIGLVTDHCVSTTARMSANFGYDTYVVSDATATFDKVLNGKRYSAELIHETALASLHEEFATIVTTEQILQSLNE